MIDIAGLMDKIVSHPMTLGLLEAVSTHEPKSAPGKGKTAAIFLQALEPIQSSGLAATSGRVEFRCRIYQNMTADPQDFIDPDMLDVCQQIMNAFSGDFDLGATVRMVDLLGAYGKPMSALAAYIPQDGKLYRILDVVLPIIVNDIWDQEN